MKGNKKPVDNLNSIDKDEQITVAPSTENREGKDQGILLNEITNKIDKIFDEVKAVVEASEQKTLKAIEDGKAELDAYKKASESKLEELIRLQAQNTMLILENLNKLAGEVNALKEQLDGFSKTSDKYAEQVEKLRDQMFAISMLEVVDGGADKFESYNNVIFDEICALRQDFDAINEKVSSGEVTADLVKSVESLIDNTDVIKARLQIEDEAKDNAVNVKNALDKREDLTRSIDDLKSELKKLVEDIGAEL